MKTEHSSILSSKPWADSTGCCLRCVQHLFCSGGASVIFDCVGASAWDFNSRVAAQGARYIKKFFCRRVHAHVRWILYGGLGGLVVQNASLGRLLSKHIRLEATTLRSRSLEYRAELVQSFGQTILPRFASGDIQVLHPLGDFRRYCVVATG